MMRKLFGSLVLAATLAFGGAATSPEPPQNRTRIQNGASLPANCNTGELFALTAGDIGTHECIASNTWRKIHGGGGNVWGQEFHPADYGALCDGSTDDSAALQDALDDANAVNGTLVLPATTCAFATGLIVGGNSTLGAYSHVNIRGVSEDVSRLLYTGADAGSGIGLYFKHNAYFRAESFLLQGPALTKTHAGTTVGIQLGAGSGTGGTMTLTGTFSHVKVMGFYIGMLAGDTDAASEIDCNRCEFVWNNYGWSASGQNSLNFWFYGLGLGFNGAGMQLGNIGGGGSTSDSPHVYGGHGTHNDRDFALENSFGILTIKDWRSEDGGLFLYGGGSAVVAEGVTITPTVNPDGRIIDVSNMSLDLRNSSIAGKIRYSLGSVGTVILKVTNTLIQPFSSTEPVEFTGGLGNVYIDYYGIRDFDYPRLPLADKRGLVTTANGAYVFLPETSTIINATGNTVPGLELNSVRMLALGTLAHGKNLRDTATFATSATKAYTFKKTLTVDTATSRIITATSGTFTPSDTGKVISITDGATDCGYAGGGGGPAPLVGTIASVTDSTHAVFAPGQFLLVINNCAPTMSALSGKTATVGEDEPDTNYIVVGLSCDTTGETFKWGSLATTGFTLTSSNASSTATCNFLIVR